MLLFVNNKYTIEIESYSSIYLLKDLVKKKLKLKNSKKDIHLWFNGKLLNNESKSLQNYNLKNNSNIEVSSKLKGGSSESTWFFYILYYISIPIFICFICSGFPPFIANVYAYIFDKTVVSILEMFNMKKEDATSKMIRNVLNGIMWILTKLATIFFIWIIKFHII